MGRMVPVGSKREMLPRASARIRVFAHCYDEDTPIVELHFPDGSTHGLTDTSTQELIDRLKRALDVLPTSK